VTAMALVLSLEVVWVRVVSVLAQLLLWLLESQQVSVLAQMLLS